MDLQSMVANEKTVKLEYPGLKGFEVELVYLSREELNKIRQKCVQTTINPKTRQPEETLDDDLFFKIYIDKVIKNWTGLKMKHLEHLIVLNKGENFDPEQELPYSQENARTLMQSSPNFDAWVTEVINDVSNFNKDS